VETRQDLLQPLRIETGRDLEPVKREPAYNPQVEAISPTLPAEDDNKTSKEDLLQAITKVDREIQKAVSQITKLKKTQVRVARVKVQSVPSRGVSLGFNVQSAPSRGMSLGSRFNPRRTVQCFRLI